MPQWSVAEWRARVGGSWLAIGRPIKSKSSSSSGGAGCMQRVLTMNCVVIMMCLMMVLIGVNLLLRALLVDRSDLRPITDLLEFGILSYYWINSDYLFLTVSTALSLHKFFPSIIIMCLRHFASSLKQGLCLTSRLLCVLASLKSPLIRPFLLFANFVMNDHSWLRAVSIVKMMLLASDQVAVLEPNSSVVKEELELRDRGELLRRLALSSAHLDIVLSVAVCVIIYKLLKSGDVEKNPGPGNLDYNSVDASTTLVKGDLCDVMEEVHSIQSRFYALGRSLRLETCDLIAIRNKYLNASDSELALQDVMLLWLEQKYDAEKYGRPTWRMLVTAVDKETGGNNHELAKKIAEQHPAEHQSKYQRVMEATKQAEKDLLDIGNIREVHDVLWKYRAKWKLIGMELQIKPEDLDAIDVDNRTIEGALLEVIKLWLRRVNPKPTRTVLMAVTQSKLLEESQSDTKVSTQKGHAQKAEEYTQYMKSLYKAQTLASFSDCQWPPPCTHKVFRLAMIKHEEMRRGHTGDDAVLREMTISGKVDNIIKCKIPVELENIFKVKNEENEVKKVLMEGAPGSGKSTLSFHMCRQWMEGHLFREFNLVILVKLREPTVQCATSLNTLLPRQNDPMGMEIEDIITAIDGKDILFILDGWDELPCDVPAHSLILNLVNGTKLPASSVIITSRPTSSAILHHLVHRQIKILGFTKNELQQYFTKCLENNGEAVQRLLQRIKQNPIIEGSCYLPLNASILVHLFKCRNNVLPTTQYGILTELVNTCIYRHLKKTCHDIKDLESLDKLPLSIADQFRHLCSIAYDGVMQDKVIFDLGSNFNTLGLLQGVESFAIRGKLYSYNFLHLSIQKLLCALHMVNELDEIEQTEQFKNLFGQPRFMLVFQFFAAKTKLKTSGVSEIVTQVAKKCSGDHPSSEDKTLLVSLMHCLFEAQDSSLCQLVASKLKHKLTLVGTCLDPTDCYYLGYFLTFCDGFDVHLANCSIGDDHCKSLFRSEKVSNFRSLNLGSNDIGREGAIAVAAAMKTATNLRELVLNSNHIGIEGAKAMAATIETASNLQKLNLEFNGIGREGAVAVATAIKTATNLQELNLYNNIIGVEGAMAVTEAMKTTTNLQKLYLAANDIGDEGAVAVARAMTTATNLQELHLGVNKIGAKGATAVALAMKTATNLQKVDMSFNDMGIGEIALRVAAMETGIRICILSSTVLQDSNILTESDIRILNLVLSEHLTNLEKSGLSLKQGERITKERVVMHLRYIDQHELAEIFSKDNGVQLLQNHIHDNVYKKALQDTEHIVNLQVFRMVLCGVPRSGKTTFWKRIAIKDFKPSPESASTGAAESYIISAVGREKQESDRAHVHTEMLFDLHLYSKDSDLHSEALTVYKLILERHARSKPEPETNVAKSQDNSERDKPQDEPQASKNEMQTSETQEGDESVKDSKAYTSKPTTDNGNTQSDDKRKGSSAQNMSHSAESDTSAQNKNPSKEQPPDPIIAEISKQIDELNLQLKGKDLPDLPNIKKMCHLQDTGGQRAFLELLPTLSTGKALYLLFFNYKDFEKSVSEKMQAEDSPEELSTGIEYNQIDIIRQSLICVSTASEGIQSTVEGQSTNNIALLVGTHVDEVKSEDLTRVDKIIHEELKLFIEKNRLAYAQSKCLVLQVAIKETELCSNKSEDYVNVIMDIVENELKSSESEELPASWYMFCIMLRRLQNAGYSVLRYNHCRHIAEKLYFPQSELKSLLFRLQNVFGIVLYFPEVEELKDIVVCDPAFVYKSISKFIFGSFRGRCDVSSLNKLQKHGIFEYKELKEHIEKKEKKELKEKELKKELEKKENHCEIKEYLKLSKLIILLKHLGIIAPINRSDTAQIAKSEYKDDSDNVDIHPDQEYVIPCVLKEAKENELNVQLKNAHACSIVPLRIYFDCGFAPMGGFCYLFTKLISNNKGWELRTPELLHTPDKEEEKHNNYWRNKVTLEVQHNSRNYLVTLLSTHKYYEIHIIHSVSEDPFQLQSEGHSICKRVWKAIHSILKESPNKPLQSYKVACICTYATDEHMMKSECKPHEKLHDEHVMKFECKPHDHEKLPNVKAYCKKCDCNRTLHTQPSVMVWFKPPRIVLEKGKIGETMHLCDLLFKVNGDQKHPKCALWLDGKMISEDDKHYTVSYKTERKLFRISISDFESELKGVYECVASTAEEPPNRVSTSVEVVVKYGRESCAAGSSALADYHNAGTVKYQTMIKCTEELRIAVSDNLATLSGCFFANGLISDHNRQEVTNVHNSSVDRAVRLVEIIQRKVQLNHQNYDMFIDVLKQVGSDYYNDILSKLSETLRDYEIKQSELQMVEAEARSRKSIDDGGAAISKEAAQSRETDKDESSTDHISAEAPELTLKFEEITTQAESTSRSTKRPHTDDSTESKGKQQKYCQQQERHYSEKSTSKSTKRPHTDDSTVPKAKQSKMSPPPEREIESWREKERYPAREREREIDRKREKDQPRGRYIPPSARGSGGAYRPPGTREDREREPDVHNRDYHRDQKRDRYHDRHRDSERDHDGGFGSAHGSSRERDWNSPHGGWRDSRDERDGRRGRDSWRGGGEQDRDRDRERECDRDRDRDRRRHGYDDWWRSRDEERDGGRGQRGGGDRLREEGSWRGGGGRDDWGRRRRDRDGDRERHYDREQEQDRDRDAWRGGRGDRNSDRDQGDRQRGGRDRDCDQERDRRRRDQSRDQDRDQDRGWRGRDRDQDRERERGNRDGMRGPGPRDRNREHDCGDRHRNDDRERSPRDGRGRDASPRTARKYDDDGFEVVSRRRK